MKLLRAWLLIPLLLGVTQAAFAGTTVPNVVVTVEPLTPYVNELLKGIAHAKSLLKPGQDPHNAALSPSQAQALAEADTIIMASASMSPELARIIQKKKAKGALVIELITLKGADALPYPKDNPWLETLKEKKGGEEHHPHHGEHADEHEHEHAHKHASADPHLWLDPLRMAAIATPLAEAIAEKTPDQKQLLSANARILATHLRTIVDPQLRALLKPAAQAPRTDGKPFFPFLTYHAAYQYFLKRYGFDDAGYVTQVPDATMGARTMKHHLASSETITVGCIISEHENRLVKRIATETGARIVILNPERSYGLSDVSNAAWAINDYDRLLYKVATSFAACSTK